MPDFDAWRARHPLAAAELDALLTPVAPAESGGSEARVQSLTRLAAVKHGALWRNNAGQAELNGQPVRFGLGNESKRQWETWRSGDLVGITRVIVQPQHIGRTFGVFTMMEIKDSDWKPSRLDQPSNTRERAQMNCLRHVASLGGIAGFVCDAGRDYERYVREFIS